MSHTYTRITLISIFCASILMLTTACGGSDTNDPETETILTCYGQNPSIQTVCDPKDRMPYLGGN